MDTKQLALNAHDTQELIAKGKRDFVAPVREASRSGMSQRAITRAVNRSQPEIARILHFNGKSAQAHALRKNRRRLMSILSANQLSNLRVFGSVVKDNARADSDIDLLVTAQNHLSLLTQAAIEQELSEALGFPVDLVFDDQIRPDLQYKIESEAIPV
ncbi:nucleotidyltransferase family protein [Arcanobacterium hippocoleae]|uniref:nucleotidyltransferase family protein n=1 Tax=Arcanobacterium hippocoleae TaxID=149017 RepID=UPI003340DC81